LQEEAEADFISEGMWCGVLASNHQTQCLLLLDLAVQCCSGSGPSHTHATPPMVFKSH